VSKTVTNGRTVATLRALDVSGRIDELASMIGGHTGGSSAREHARAALVAADEWKAGRVLAERVAR